ncbi:MAG: hypothetical protein WEB60_09265 [Terrimicrobiaceae bacterium]
MSPARAATRYKAATITTDHICSHFTKSARILPLTTLAGILKV